MLISSPAIPDHLDAVLITPLVETEFTTLVRYQGRIQQYVAPHPHGRKVGPRPVPGVRVGLQFIGRSYLSLRKSVTTMASFDIVSKIDVQTLDNAINSAKREIETRYDLRGSNSSIELDPRTY